MVLVELETEFGDRQMDESVFIRFETVPLHQQVEGSHGETQSCLEVVPNTMHHFLEVPDQGEHREYGFHHHALIPLPTFAEFEVGGVSLTGMETRITQHHHLVLKSLNQVLKSGVVRLRGCDFLD